MLGEGKPDDDSAEETRAIFWSRSEGIYFSYTYRSAFYRNIFLGRIVENLSYFFLKIFFGDARRQWKIMACKAFLRVVVIVTILMLLLLFWYTCDECIYVMTTGSCLVCFLGAQYLAPACAAGVVCSLFKGVHLGAGPFHFDVRWDT
jgi:hypothetical protein